MQRARLPEALVGWDGKSDLLIGCPTDESKLCIELKCTTHVFAVPDGVILDRSVFESCYSEQERQLRPPRPIVVLWMISVPESDRKQGLATEIVTCINQHIANRAKSDERIVFAIGPLMGQNDALHKIAKKIGGFLPAMPFSLVKKYN